VPSGASATNSQHSEKDPQSHVNSARLVTELIDVVEASRTRLPSEDRGRVEASTGELPSRKEWPTMTLSFPAESVTPRGAILYGPMRDSRVAGLYPCDMRPRDISFEYFSSKKASCNIEEEWLGGEKVDVRVKSCKPTVNLKRRPFGTSKKRAGALLSSNSFDQTSCLKLVTIGKMSSSGGALLGAVLLRSAQATLVPVGTRSSP
jgi:hypothetical protein